MAEIIMNGVLDEEVNNLYHICFFTDQKGHDPDDFDNYIFIPKSVCRVVDDISVSILDWYVHKKKLHRFIRGSGKVMYKRLQAAKKPAAQDIVASWKNKKPIGRFKPVK